MNPTKSKVRRRLNWIRAAASWGALLVLLGHGSVGSSQIQDRRLWAYPGGVLISISGERFGGLDAPSNQPPKKDRPSPDLTLAKRSFAQDLLRVERTLKVCAEALRESSPQLAQSRASVVLRVQMGVDPTGRVGYVDFKGRPIPRYFVECAAKVMVALREAPLPPRLDQRTLVIEMRLEIRFLSDDEAQGRGFRYYTAEETWEARVAKHREWFGCRLSPDCTLTAEDCQVRAINRAYLAEYLAEIRQRPKNLCAEPPDLERYRPLCRQGRCAAVKKP